MLLSGLRKSSNLVNRNRLNQSLAIKARNNSSELRDNSYELQNRVILNQGSTESLPEIDNETIRIKNKLYTLKDKSGVKA